MVESELRENGSREERKEEGTKAEDGSKPSWACIVGFLDGPESSKISGVYTSCPI